MIGISDMKPPRKRLAPRGLSGARLTGLWPAQTLAATTQNDGLTQFSGSEWTSLLKAGATADPDRRSLEPHMDEADLIRRAFLRYVQTENIGCEATGDPCREPAKCGCHQEMTLFILATPEATNDLGQTSQVGPVDT